MKKYYITPAVSVTTVEIESLLAAQSQSKVMSGGSLKSTFTMNESGQYEDWEE